VVSPTTRGRREFRRQAEGTSLPGEAWSVRERRKGRYGCNNMSGLRRIPGNYLDYFEKYNRIIVLWINIRSGCCPRSFINT
jgi:hypothetical protein